MALWLFDLPLLLMLLGLAWRLLTSPHPFTAVVLFIAFGLLMAIAWARLGAPDVALAEAAIGAGLTGALLLSALKDIESLPRRPRPAWPMRAALVGLSLTLFLAIAWTLLALPTESLGLGPLVRSELPRSGAENPVTAVLLNFRGYDTLLEVAVLLVAVVPIWWRPARTLEPSEDPGPILVALVQLIVPLAIVIGGYLLWLGSASPGGGFQAGAILGAAFVLLLLADITNPGKVAPWMVRCALGLSLAIFVGVAVGLMTTGRHLLEYSPSSAGWLLVLIETALMVSTALTLTVLFMGGKARP